MPAAKKFRLPALRTSSTGVAQEDGAGGGGDSTSLIWKSPFAARGTPFWLVLRSVNGAVFSQMSVAKTLMTAAPPEAEVPIAVPMVSPPANTRPFPLTVMCPSTVTSAWKSAIAHGVLGGWTPRTMLRVTVVAVVPVPNPAETPIAPIAPSNVTKVSSATDGSGVSTTAASSNDDGIFMGDLRTVRVSAKEMIREPKLSRDFLPDLIFSSGFTSSGRLSIRFAGANTKVIC